MRMAETEKYTGKSIGAATAITALQALVCGYMVEKGWRMAPVSVGVDLALGDPMAAHTWAAYHTLAGVGGTGSGSGNVRGGSNPGSIGGGPSSMSPRTGADGGGGWHKSQDRG